MAERIIAGNGHPLKALISIVLLAMASGVPAEGEQKIFHYRVVEEDGVDVAGRDFDVVVSETRIRKEMGRESLILDAAAGKALLVDHALKETFEFDLPVHRDKLLADKLVEAYRQLHDEVSIEIVDTSAAEESTTIAGYECRDHSVRFRALEGRVVEEVTACLTLGPFPEAALYWRLVAVESELIPGREQLWQHLSEIGGFPLRWRIDSRRGQRRYSFTRVLEKIEVVAPDAAAFLPNPDYKRSAPDPQGRFMSRPRSLPGI